MSRQSDLTFDCVVLAIIKYGEAGRFDRAAWLAEMTVRLNPPVSPERWQCLAEALAVASSDAAMHDRT